jgi:hypothetical protein
MVIVRLERRNRMDEKQLKTFLPGSVSPACCKCRSGRCQQSQRAGNQTGAGGTKAVERQNRGQSALQAAEAALNRCRWHPTEEKETRKSGRSGEAPED